MSSREISGRRYEGRGRREGCAAAYHVTMLAVQEEPTQVDRPASLYSMQVVQNGTAAIETSLLK
jgi:hypothetical protein